MENHPFKYDIDFIEPGVVHFEDNIDSSFYLIEGQDKALLIDTGCGGGNVHRLASAFTDKPIELAVTHAHGDHDAHAAEFSVAYMHPADIAQLEEMNRIFEVPEDEQLHAEQFTPVSGGDAIELGDCTVRVLEMAGHTPGSVIFVDEGHRVVFTGDAVGSGVGVWMQLRNCCCISQYRKNLLALLDQLAPYRDYLYLGGHYRQAGEPGSPSFNPVTPRMIEDLVTVCDELLAGKAKVEEYAPAGRFGEEITYIAYHGAAALVYLPSYVK